MSEQNKELIQLVSAVLLRCWIMSFVLLGIGFVGTQFAHDFVADLHASMFGLDTHEVDIIFYCALGLIKLFAIFFFFIPWLSLKLVTSMRSP